MLPVCLDVLCVCTRTRTHNFNADDDTGFSSRTHKIVRNNDIDTDKTDGRGDTSSGQGICFRSIIKYVVKNKFTATVSVHTPQSYILRAADARDLENENIIQLVYISYGDETTYYA